MATVSTAARAVDIDALWEYEDPERSEARFRAALAGADGDDRLEILTQVARSLGLRNEIERAHRLLDEVASQLAGAGPRPRVRYLLERGRVFNAAHQRDKARMNFIEAWDLARSAALEGLAVDAAHMVAITLGGTDAAIQWNQQALALARSSRDTKARALIPALLNNAAWDLHDLGRYDEALPLFEQALAEWSARGRPEQIRFARWSLARCLRSLGRYRDALSIQLELQRQPEASAGRRGDVLEEIGELYAALGQSEEARAYFGRAASVLGEDPRIGKDDPDRLARLRAKAK